MAALNSGSEGGRGMRKAAVAGQFYAAAASVLKQEIAGYLSQTAIAGLPPKLLISPHAGYVFSGPLAGKCFSTIKRGVKRVVIIGPSHYQHFKGIAVSGASWYETPLGNVRVDEAAVRALRQSTLIIPANQAEDPEHSIEVQLPFLQVVLGDSFSIVPLLAGNVDPVAAADLLAPLLDENTIVVASSDLSHFLDQKTARATDDRSIETILSGNIDGEIDGCGEMPIRIVMQLANAMNLKPELLDAKTSIETAPQHGSPNRVVGYAAIVYRENGPKRELKPKASLVELPRVTVLETELKNQLLKLARASLEAAVRGEKAPLPDSVTSPSLFRENRGCFVTLTSGGGRLRGCIGYIEPIMPLFQAIMENARNAALHDPRFSPVQPGELPEVKVEVSVLTKPTPLPYKDPDDLLRKLTPGTDGVILQNGRHQSTFLPQVWEQLPDKIMFLEHLAAKGGMARDGWKTAQVKTYRAEHFGE